VPFSSLGAISPKALLLLYRILVVFHCLTLCICYFRKEQNSVRRNDRRTKNSESGTDHAMISNVTTSK